MFDILVHADWSSNEEKRWMAFAERTLHGWEVDAPRPAPSGPKLNGLIESWVCKSQTVLAGFDFPIGVPVTFGKQSGFAGFLEALFEFGKGDWKHFFDVADSPEDISTWRPFYPDKSRGGHRQAHLFGPLGVSTIDELRRECERKTTDGRRAACPIFWTLGGNQVGKAAIHGWQNVIRPAHSAGAHLWPFNGQLRDLSTSPGCVLCETYPRKCVWTSGNSVGSTS